MGKRLKSKKMTECEEEVERLEAEVKDLTGKLQQILDEEKYIGTVLSGPEMKGEKAYYRVKISTTEKLVTYTPTDLFGKDAKIEVNSEVVIAGDSIVSVLPEKLKIERERVSTTKLVSWEDIGGMRSQVMKIRETIEGPMMNQELALEMGVEPIKGILLYGPPGCGKTMIAKAIAKTILIDDTVSADAFIYMKGAEVLSPLVGVAEQTIRTTFENTRKYAQKTGKRAVLFIDEAEAILARRGSRFSSDVDSTIVPSFLAEMDGFDGDSPIVLLATNRPNSLDDAVTRPERIDMKIEIARPSRADVMEMFDIHLRKVKASDAKDIIANMGTMLMFQPETMAKVSGAMVKAMVKMAATNALARRVRNKSCAFGITVDDVQESYDVLKATPYEEAAAA